MKTVVNILKYAIGVCILIAVGVTNLASTIKLLADMAAWGAEGAVEKAVEPTKKYLDGLEWLLRTTFLPSLAIGVIALILATWIGWMRAVVGWMGVWCFVWTIALGHYAVPLAALIGLLAEKKEPKDTPFIQGQRERLGRSLKKYVSFVRQVLIYEAAAFITLTMVPVQNYWIGVPLFLLWAGLLITTSYDWGTGTGKWLKPAIRFAGFAWIVCFVLSCFLPKVKFFNFLFYKGQEARNVGAGLPNNLGEVTGPHLWEFKEAVESWAIANWIGLLVAFVVICIFWMWRKKTAKAPAGAGGSSGRSSSGSGTGWLGMAVMLAICFLCLAWGYKHVVGAHEEHNGRIASQLEEKRTYETMRATMRTAEEAARKAAAAIRQTTAVATTPQPEVWCGLISPQKYSISLSTNLSERIPRPAGCSTHMEPSGLPYEFWVNGAKIQRIPCVPTGIPVGTTYVQYRWTNSYSTIVVVGVGREIR